jgi:radical SAM protein with 4Fe4S-binding SPASM domain
MTSETSVAAERRFSLGLGLTNECNLACAFCYRDPTRTDRLSLAQVQQVLARLPVRSVNLGTGENGMHPEFREMLGYLRAQPIKLTITSNGYSVAVLKDAELRCFSDVEFSLDYPTREEQDAQRGPGNWDLIQEQARRCRDLGVGITIIAVMMRTNHLRLAELAEVARAFGAPLRINVYQAVRSDTFALTYDEYWDGFARLFAETDTIAVGEPLVRAMAGLPPRQGGCGIATVRVTPRATVQPCVYWPGGAPLDLLLDAGERIIDSGPFADARSVPSACAGCAHRATCGGGCAGRRRLLEALDRPDLYCPVVRGDNRRLALRMAPRRDLPKLESACTTIVTARA